MYPLASVWPTGSLVISVLVLRQALTTCPDFDLSLIHSARLLALNIPEVCQCLCFYTSCFSPHEDQVSVHVLTNKGIGIHAVEH